MNQARDFWCRFCRSTRGWLVLDLGTQPLANNLPLPGDDLRAEPTFPLRLTVCANCWLMQIADVVPPVKLFSEYLYFSSCSNAMLQHARKASERYLLECKLNPASMVVEIASNDGYLLKNFRGWGVPCFGIEPARNIAAAAREAGVRTVADFFTEELAEILRPADLILANNVFAHAPDINDFVAGLHELLKPDGQAVLEFPYGVEMIERAQFDTIYHEHVFYFTLSALMPVFARAGLEIHRAERIEIHGGSLRIFAGHQRARAVDQSVDDLLIQEGGKGVTTAGWYENFAARVAGRKRELTETVAALQARGKTVAGYGASAKGSTLLNYCGLDSLAFIADRSPHKQGRLTPGTHIPIAPAGALLERQPDYTLLLTWNFAEEIMREQQEYQNRGGQFIVPA